MSHERLQWKMKMKTRGEGGNHLLIDLQREISVNIKRHSEPEASLLLQTS